MRLWNRLQRIFVDLEDSRHFLNDFPFPPEELHVVLDEGQDVVTLLVGILQRFVHQNMHEHRVVPWAAGGPAGPPSRPAPGANGSIRGVRVPIVDDDDITLREILVE